MSEVRTVTIDKQVMGLAERLLTIPKTLSQIKDPEEYVERAAQALAEVLEADYTINWRGLPDEPVTPADPNALRLTVDLQEAAFAAIDLTGGHTQVPLVRRTLDHVTADLTYCLDCIAFRQIRDAQRALTALMLSINDIYELAASGTKMWVEQLGAEAGLLLARHTAEFRVLGSAGDWPVDTQAMPSWQAAALRGIQADSAMAHPGDLITCPVSTSSPARLVLLLRCPPGRGSLRNKLPLLNDLARTAAPYLDALRRDGVLTELLELNQASEAINTVELYDRVLKTAVQVIPGSEAGTLLTRQHPGEQFEFQAALGFDLTGLKANPVSEAAMLAWYGANDRGWEIGRPRILTRNDVNFEEYGPATTPGSDTRAAAYDTIQSTLCLPVLRDGVVLAVLNVDNLTDPEAFGSDSIRLAKLFGAPLASLLYRQQTHDLLKAAALTDELTGLANRRAFDQALGRELGRVARKAGHTSVMMMDVRGFKRINDRFGHEAGDEALFLIARALEATLRITDLPARIGGDEFVALLVDTPSAEAALIADRVRRAVAGITIRPGVRLAIDIGLASAPAEGDTASELLRAADERMYAEKLVAT